MHNPSRHSRTSRWLLGFCLGGLACSHTQTIGDTGSHAPTKPRVERKADDASGDLDQHRKKRPATTKDDTSGSEPPLAMSPAGLLKSGAIASLQEKLADRGYLKRQQEPDKRSGLLDASTLKALRAFQNDNNLPATGVPDDLTVQKLRLSPAEIFRAAKTP